jgi:acyl-CoA synthetase (NDP forming)
MGGVAVPGTATEDETLAAAQAGLYAVKALSHAALERLEVEAVPTAQVVAVREAAGALIDAMSPVLSRRGEDHYVGQIVGIARSLYGA